MLKTEREGFTIVELLIVIVVIGILALLVLTTYSGIQARARNTKRQDDIKKAQTQIEAFFTQNNYYPSLGDLNSATWRSSNMKGFDANALVDPSGNTNCLTTNNCVVSSVQAKAYSYAVTDSSGNSCEGAGNDVNCAKYTLTASYEGTVNGQTNFALSNLD